MRRALAFILVVLAVGIVLSQGIGGATPPSTAHGFGYLLWSQEDAARVWVLDGDGGLRHEHTLTYPGRRSADPADVWRARELVVAGDGTKRLLWTNLARGRSEVWTLNDALEPSSVRAFQASDPAANWYATSFEKNPGGTGRMAWFNAFVGSAVVWSLDANEAKVGTHVFTPSADAGAWVPVEYGRAPDGSQRLVWTYTWNGSGQRGGRSVVWFLDGNDQKLGSQILNYAPDTYLRSYRFENDGRLRFLIADDAAASGKVCTALADAATVPSGTGWEPGQCRTFGPEPGWILRSYAGNTPLDLSGQERAIIEREAARLGYPEESFVSPDEVRVGDMLLRTTELSLEGGAPGTPVYYKNVKKWSGGRLALKFPAGAPVSFIENVLNACRRWADVSGVSCVPGPGPFLDVRYASGGVCLGTLGYEPHAYLTSGLDGVCAAHEFGHVLGMVHTHQREDRDDYVTVHPEEANPNYVGAIRDRFRVPEGFGPYDFFSVMHYEPYAFSITGQPTITRHNGSTNLGGVWVPTTIDAAEAQRLYPGQGSVSPASAFVPGTPTPTPPPGGGLDLFLSNVVVDGQAYTPSYLPTFHAGQTFDMVLVVTNNGRAWEAAEQIVLSVTHWGHLEILNGGGANSLTIPIVDTVPPGGQVGIPVQVRVSSALSAAVLRVDVALYAEGQYAGVQRAIYLYVLPSTAPVPGPTGHLEATAVLPDLSVVAPGHVLPFRVMVRNPTSQAELVRVRGYLGGAIVTDIQQSYQVGVVEPGATTTFSFVAMAPDVEGTMKAYGQLYTLVGTQPYTGNESADVEVNAPLACGGCDFTGVGCGHEGACVNNPNVGCGQVLICSAPCVPVAEVQQVSVPPSVPPNSAFTVTTRLKNLAAQVNTLSVRGYTDLAGATPFEALRTETLLPFETRTVTFSFNAPSSGTFQAHTQLYCAGDPLPFVGNSSSPASVGGSGGPYAGVIPSADFVHLTPDPAYPNQTVTAHGRVLNHNNYTSWFYLRPYSDADQELGRVLVEILPHGSVTEAFTFNVPNAPGGTLGVHFQVEHTIGQPLSGNSASVGISNVPNPRPTPTPPPEETCPGPNDGDFTNCPVHNGNHQTYRSCQSCRSAYPWASYCKQKTELNFCWKPMP